MNTIQYLYMREHTRALIFPCFFFKKGEFYAQLSSFINELLKADADLKVVSCSLNFFYLFFYFFVGCYHSAYEGWCQPQSGVLYSVILLLLLLFWGGYYYYFLGGGNHSASEGWWCLIVWFFFWGGVLSFSLWGWCRLQGVLWCE